MAYRRRPLGMENAGPWELFIVSWVTVLVVGLVLGMVVVVVLVVVVVVGGWLVFENDMEDCLICYVCFVFSFVGTNMNGVCVCVCLCVYVVCGWLEWVGCWEWYKYL